jgi:hypothetical protein
MSAKKQRLLDKKKGVGEKSASQQLLDQVVPFVSLQHLQLVKASFELLPSTATGREEPLQTSVLHNYVPEEQALVTTVAFDFLSQAPIPREQKPFVRVMATYILKYKLLAKAVPSQDALGFFSRVNATYNAWPYWREFLAGSLQRLELPPLTLQLMRIESLVEWAEKNRISNRS